MIRWKIHTPSVRMLGKQFASAEEQLRRAIEVAPRQAGRFIDLAKLFTKQGRYQDADINLAKAEQIGAIPIDFTKGDPAEQIRELTSGEGTDKGVDAVGYQAQAHDASHEEPAFVLNHLVETVRPTGMLGVPGLYVPSDPGGPDEHARHGQLLLSIGRMFEKGQRMGTGQCNVKRYNRQLRDLIMAGRAKPSFVVSHELPLDQAPPTRGYEVLGHERTWEPATVERSAAAVEPVTDDRYELSYGDRRSWDPLSDPLPDDGTDPAQDLGRRLVVDEVAGEAADGHPRQRRGHRRQRHRDPNLARAQAPWGDGDLGHGTCRRRAIAATRRRARRARPNRLAAYAATAAPVIEYPAIT